jgi:hypothetical protein
MKVAHIARTAGRLAGALLAAGGLLAGLAGGARPAAADHLQAPQLLSAEPISSSSIRLTWRDTNTVPLDSFGVAHYLNGTHWAVGKYVVIPASKDLNGIRTHDVTNLTLGQTYCFFVHARAPHPNPEVLALDSTQSITRCLTLETPYLRTRPHTCPGCAVTAGPLSTHAKKLPGDIIAQPDSAPPAPTKPDLAAVRVSGPATLRQGISHAYTAEIKNEGSDANATVALNIIFYGALEPGFQTSFSAEAGLYCERDAATAAGTTGVIKCAGGTLRQGQTATVTFQVRAARTGQGNLVAEINPSRTLEESNYDNNRTPAIGVVVSQ